jgi:hypothetical protein
MADRMSSYVATEDDDGSLAEPANYLPILVYGLMLMAIGWQEEVMLDLPGAATAPYLSILS